MKFLNIVHNSKINTGGKISHKLLMEGLEDKGHQIDFLSTEEYEEFRTFLMKDYMNVSFLGLRQRKVADQIRKKVDVEDYDYIYTNGYYSMPATLKACKNKEVETISHFRDYWFADVNGTFVGDDGEYYENCNIRNIWNHNKKTRFLWNFYKFQYLKKLKSLFSTSDYNIATSNSVSNELKDLNIDSKVVPNPVRIDKYRGERKENKKFTAGFIGRLEQIKGTDVILKLIERHPDIEFKIAGSGSEEERMRDYLKDKNNGEFCGWIDRSDVGEFYRSLDVTLYPSIVPEGFGRIAVESMAAGTPVIASNRGGLKDIVEDNKQGFLLNPTDVNSWSEALNKLKNNKNLHENMVKRAKERSESFTLNKHIDKFLQAIK